MERSGRRRSEHRLGPWKSYAVLRPFGMDGVYVNNLGDEGHERVKAAYGENYDRLVMLKRKYDRDNLFRLDPETSIP